MVEVLGLQERPQSLGEEVANSVSHGIGLLVALAAFPVLLTAALNRGDLAGIVGASVFATTMVLLYLTSTLFHAFPQSRAKRVFQILDHSAIFLLIAGTYTPFTLGVLRGDWGWTLFATSSPSDCGRSCNSKAGAIALSPRRPAAHDASRLRSPARKRAPTAARRSRRGSGRRSAARPAALRA